MLASFRDAAGEPWPQKGVTTGMTALMVLTQLLLFNFGMSNSETSTSTSVLEVFDGKTHTATFHYSLTEKYEISLDELNKHCEDFGDPDSPRKALLIGNSKYTLNSELRNPGNDVELIKTTLTGVGFSGRACKNLDHMSMGFVVANFVSSLRPSDTSLFYFSGHGSERLGENFLYGSNDEPFPLKNILAKLEARADSTVNVVMLDACRNDPTKKNAGRGFTAEAGVTGVYIAYASAEGKTALDHYGTREKPTQNSPFARAFADVVESRLGLEVDFVFREVRSRVQEWSDKTQAPWSASSLIGYFYFRPVEPAPVPNPSLENPVIPAVSD